jgi:hypothetical protein
MGATKDSSTCGSMIWDSVSAIGEAAFSIAELGSSESIEVASQNGQAAERITKMNKKF